MADPPAHNTLLQPSPRNLHTILPILRWMPNYEWKHITVDALAGISLAAFFIPESIGYAGLAGVPPEAGLYAALAAIIGYALFGRVSVLVVGPASAVAAVSGSIVATSPSGVDPLAATAALAIMCGAMLIVAGVLRMGWIVNFISKPVLEAFVAGLAISIIIGQLDGLLGVEIEGESPLAKFIDLLSQVSDWHGPTALIGVSAVATIFLLKRFAKRVPAAIVVVVAGIALISFTDLAKRGVAVVGEIPQGLPSIGIPDLNGIRWYELIGGAAALLLIGFSEGYAAASAVVDSTGEELDPDQELIASGVGNVFAGFAGGMAVSGSLSKSAASQAAGARTQMANLSAGLVVLATLLFLGPVFQDLPEPVLASVVIAAVLGAADPRRVLTVWDANRLDFAAAIVTFTLVLVWDTLPALLAGVLISIGFVVRRASFPDVVELGPNAQGLYHKKFDRALVPADSTTLVLRFEAPLVFANATRLRRAALALVGRSPTATRFVLDAEMLSDLDATGAEMLERLDDELAKRHVELHLARIHDRARRQLDRSGLTARFEARIHPTVKSAIGTL